MPIYEYKCDTCDEVFEVIQKFSDEPLKVHEKCGGPVHRLISPSAFQFKGSGWYVTDYAKKSDGKSPANGSSHSKDDSSGESKPAENGSAKSEKSSESKSAESKPASSTPAPAPSTAKSDK